MRRQERAENKALRELTGIFIQQQRQLRGRITVLERTVKVQEELLQMNGASEMIGGGLETRQEELMKDLGFLKDAKV